MLRLLQGDVGSGKTLVALMCLLVAVEAGAQGALLAPTEILARQHHAVLAPLLAAAGVGAAVLTGRDKGKARQAALARLADGSAGVAVGTHALFQKGVAFRDLAVAVIDEQLPLRRSPAFADAAQGPRARHAGHDGDADPAHPHAHGLWRHGGLAPAREAARAGAGHHRRPSAAVAARRGGRRGRPRRAGGGSGCIGCARWSTNRRRWTWLRPNSATLRFPSASAARTGLIHGRMAAAERDAAMAAFASGERDILVATTVVEVGLDVPEATAMVIEGAERFGLAQLHQLRGRVGRGGRRASCLLLYRPPLGEVARARLDIMRETEDGFRIAEEDLKLRGAGELLGTRQSGAPDFRLADLSAHGDLAESARDEAREILDSDPELATPRGAALRVLLYLFERDLAISFLRSG